MNPCHRWPLHPAPIEGEALSAWLSRVAKCYEMNLEDLLLYEWGKGQMVDLDIRPPDGFLEIIARRTGVGLDTLRCMTMAGWVPWLLDSFDHEDDAFNCYVNQFSVLLPQKVRPMRTVPGWRAWLPTQNLNRACPICLSDTNGEPIFKLMWQFPIFVSCPVHSCWLEPFTSYAGRFNGWENKELKPREAGLAIKILDHRTEQAFTNGYVELPRRKVHAGLWFRLLRTLIDELNTPLLHWGAQSRILRLIWEKCGHAVRAGQAHWYPFEMLDVPVQLQFVEATAMAIYMIEAQEIKAQGTLAFLFSPGPDRSIDHGQNLALNQGFDTTVNYWQMAKESLVKTIDDARSDPEVAQRLFKLLVYGQQDPKYIDSIRERLSTL